MKVEPPAPGITIRAAFHVARASRAIRLREGPPPPLPVTEDVPKVDGGSVPASAAARSLAHAYMFQGMLDRSEVKDRAELARRLGLTPARVTQIMDLLCLAPEIQAEILRGAGAEIPDGDWKRRMPERGLRVIAAEPEWSRQREIFWSDLRAGSPTP